MDDTGNTALSSNMLSGVLAQNSAGQNVTGAVVTADPSDTNPSMDGTADPGSSSTYSRGDHVHPTDTSRAAASHNHAISDITNLQTTLNGKADDSDIPTKTSELTNDSGFLTAHQDISGKLNTNGNGSSVTVTFTQASSRTNIATGTTLATAFSRIAKWLSDLGSLAFKSEVAKSDLASGVQTSLGLADTALQSYTETDPTVPSWAKASSKPTYTYSEVGAAAASHGTHVTYSTTAPVMDGTASAGSASTVARSDHRHPTDTSRAAASHTHTISDITNLQTTLDGKADDADIPTKVSDLTNDVGYLTSYTETDPTVPAWAKASTKPTYTYSEVGAAASSHTHSDYAAKTTITTATLSASNWSGSTYSALQTTYPAASYDIEIEPNGDSCTAEQYAAWGAAQLVGSATTNVLTALGTVPTVDIPIVVKVTAK